MTGRAARKAFALTIFVAIAAIGASQSGSATASAPPCPNADTNVAAIDLRDFNGSVLCLLNERRAEYHLPALRPNGLLRDAAWIYATSMLSGKFYDHYGCVNGRDKCSTVVRRLRLLGYIRPGWAWIVGEILRGAHPDTATPSAVVEAWMESPMHRVEVLKRKYRDVGVASVRGITDAFPSTEGVTAAVELGFRKRRR